MSVLVCGEALVDLFVRPDEGGGLRTEAVLGGSPFNVAIGLARLGVPTSFLGGLSRDVFGEQLVARLVREGVSLAYAVRTTRLSTISVVGTDQNGHPTYGFHGEGKADRHLTTSDLPAVLDPQIAAIVLGSYTLAVEPVAAAHLALARREARARLISLDPNLRPTVTPDLAEWRQLFAAFLPYADIVKASDEDLATAFPGLTHDELAADWLARGAVLVVVTAGADGATAYRKGRGPVHRPSAPVDVVDTVGAGDSFHAAMLARLLSEDRLSRQSVEAMPDTALADMLAFAVAASSITCSRRGANPPQLDEMPPTKMQSI